MALAFLVNGIVPCAIGVGAGTPKLGAFGVGPSLAESEAILRGSAQGFALPGKGSAKGKGIGCWSSASERTALPGATGFVFWSSVLSCSHVSCASSKQAQAGGFLFASIECFASSRLGSQDVGLLSRHFGYGEVQSG